MRNYISKQREGMALAMAMFAIVVIGALIAGAFFASNQDFKIGRNSLVAQRAFSSAEFGLNKAMGEWDPSRNLAIRIGRDTTMSYTTGDGGKSDVRVTRVNDYTYWLVSEGNAGANTPLETRRRTSMVMRLAYPAVKVGGAVTLAGGGEVKGSSIVNGSNQDPVGWACADYPGRDTTGVAYAPGSNFSVQKASNVIGSPATYADPNAAIDGNYIKYGDESWQTLVNNADVKISADPGALAPVLNASGSCDRAVSTNWGEPWRGVGSVLPCQTYMPIIYASTSIQLNNGRGQGILLVEGNLRLNGDFEWFGLIIVKDDLIKENGSATITGAAMARNADLKNGSSVITGNVTFQYSKCALESALRGSARLVPARKRGWSEMW